MKKEEERRCKEEERKNGKNSEKELHHKYDGIWNHRSIIEGSREMQFKNTCIYYNRIWIGRRE